MGKHRLGRDMVRREQAASQLLVTCRGVVEFCSVPSDIES